MRLSRFLIFLAISTASAAMAQQPGSTAGTKPATPSGRSITRDAPSLVTFFSGSWRCTAVFPNGRTINQTMEFHPALGGAWLSAAHDDSAPGIYHALAMWGVNPGGGLVAHIADSQGGMRRFVAPEGWSADRVAFVRDTVLGSVGRYGERFTYERQSDTAFRMTYETARDTVPWHEGDHVTCGRSRP